MVVIFRIMTFIDFNATMVNVDGFDNVLLDQGVLDDLHNGAANRTPKMNMKSLIKVFISFLLDEAAGGAFNAGNLSA